ncbi:hypothetical protein HB847_15645 [Listeria booriae]|uniref:Uncharacterized protein n=1 Tax=Listeria booriae TaxID=1552123 RepID=A0A841YA45_9LIST|nr:hypothetical protein [Listeria booriae]MBC1373785.1 hypothetical protein [Listeria booriae]
MSDISRRKKRNKDIRALCVILHDKYYIDKRKIARAMKLSPAYYYDFVAETRDLLYPNLLKIENFIFDLYEPILEVEMELNGVKLDPLESEMDDQTTLDL